LHFINYTMPDRILFLTLQTFSTTGGIQKMARTLGYSISQLAKENHTDFAMWSLYDPESSLLTRYVPQENFKGFDRSRLQFILQTLAAVRQTRHLILSHINLSVVGALAKLINPDCKVYLIAHGIEVWRPLTCIQKFFLKKCDLILCVSSFTRQKMAGQHNVPLSKMQVLNNALDPFTQLPAKFNKPEYLLKRYGLSTRHQVIFTLTRLASSEQYKGYEQVIIAVAKLKNSHPKLTYILAGQYDTLEKKRIHLLICQYQVQEQVRVIGFVPDKEITDHFLLADLFVLPSKKEGFGLVFIEALACGLPVISGNADGSTDAIKDGELGYSVDPDSVDELATAIERCLSKPLDIDKRKQLQAKCTGYFNEVQYRDKLKSILMYE